MLLRCLVLVLCLTATLAQKGGSSFEPARSPSRLLAGRKIPQASEVVQQVQEPEDDRDPEEDREVVVAARPQRPRVPLPRPRDPESESHNPAPEPYSFSYSVDDPETGGSSSREETQDINGEIVGYYHIKDAEGRTRRVDYTAGKDGFKANIKSNEEGLSSRAPADVNIDLSASPSELRGSWAPNNRPAASETSVKSIGRIAPQERYFQRLLPAAFAPAPIPAAYAPAPFASAPIPAAFAPAPLAPGPIPAPPTAVETQRIEQVVQQKEEDPAEEAQISQTYDNSDPQDLQEITQQRNVDIEEAFESAPPTPRPPIKGLVAPPPPFIQQVVAPVQRPIGQFNPQRIQTFREQGLVGLQRLSAPIAQVRQEFSNTIVDPQPPASTKTIPSVAQVSYQNFRPLAPVLSSPSIPLTRPTPSVTPTFTQYNTYHQGGQAIRRPISAPYNNIVLQHTEHRSPISQERLLNYLQPINTNAQYGQMPEVVIAPQTARGIELSYPNLYFHEQQQQSVQPIPVQPVPARPLPSQPLRSGYSLSVQHRETGQYAQQPQQPIWTQQERIVEQPQQVRELVAPPPPQPLPQYQRPLVQYQYKPLPSLQSQPQQIQRSESQQFEPQTYEPLQQTYEPLQQLAEDPAEESRVEPPCKCNDRAESIPQPVKGLVAPTEPQPVKSGRLSPARAFIPQAFRSS